MRALLRLLVVVLLVVAAIALFSGYRFGGWQRTPELERPMGTSGRDDGVIDTTKARERGARIGETAASAINEAGEALGDAGLTTKIKSKMALDDLVQARRIDVDTKDGVVTLTGVVGSEAERQRAVQLAKDTRGVRSVVDRLQAR